MQHYQDTTGALHALDPAYAHLLPAGCVPISDADAAALRRPPPLTPEQLAAQAVAAVQAHLDERARERHYDDIVSACSYAAAANAFQAEGQAFLAWRAACWAHLYQVQDDVAQGRRTLPGIDALLAELPALALP